MFVGFCGVGVVGLVVVLRLLGLFVGFECVFVSFVDFAGVYVVVMLLKVMDVVLWVFGV